MEVGQQMLHDHWLNDGGCEEKESRATLHHTETQQCSQPSDWTDSLPRAFLKRSDALKGFFMETDRERERDMML